jgi:hypothetical protein
MKKTTKKKEQEQATKEREAETVRQRFAIETTLDFDMRALACRVILMDRFATATLFSSRARQAFSDAWGECTKFLPTFGLAERRTIKPKKARRG